MKNLFAGAAALATVAFVASSADASTVVVTDTDPQGWSNPAAENGNGTGHSEISDTLGRSGNGSIELSGDRTRFVLGDRPGAPGGPTSNLGLFDNFLDLSFEYNIDPAATNACCDSMYSPALRVIVWDGGLRNEFVFEQAYQAGGGYAAAGPKGTWNITSSSSTFFKLGGSENTQDTLAGWGAGLSSSAFVSSVYIGVGSGIGAGYKAYADNITFGGNTYNFETAAVPEPATWAMMIMGFGLAGSVVRRRRALAQA